MGYSHYFAYDPTASSFVAAWPQMIADARLIAWFVQTSLDIPLANGDGNGEPELGERRIWLNGPVVQGLGHEAFSINPSASNATCTQGAQPSRFAHGFCKTARMPYDIAVTSILLRFHRLAPDAFLVASDGDWRDEWQHGARHWGPGCASGASPVMLMRLLFNQVETIARCPLASSLGDAVRTVCAAPGPHR